MVAAADDGAVAFLGATALGGASSPESSPKAAKKLDDYKKMSGPTAASSAHRITETVMGESIAKAAFVLYAPAVERSISQHATLVHAVRESRRGGAKYLPYWQVANVIRTGPY